MDDIKRLVTILSDSKTHFLPQIDFSNKLSLETRLFEILQKEEVHNDEALIQHLYQSKEKAAGYRMLKSRFRRKLLNQFLTIDLSDDDLYEYQKLEAECSNMLLQAYKLIYLSEYKTATKILEQVRAIATEAVLTPIILRAIHEQKRIALILNKKEEYLRLIEDFNKYSKHQHAEDAAKDIYAMCKLELHGSTFNRKKFLPQVPGILNKLEQLWLNSQSSMIFNLYHTIRGFYFELIGDFAAVAQIQKEAEALFNDGKIHPLWYNQQFSRFLHIYSLLRTQQYEKGLALAEDYMVSFPKGSFNWFAYLENYFLLAVHYKNYSLAANILNNIYTNPVLPELHKTARSRWKMYRLFFVVLFESFTIVPEDEKTDYTEIIKDKLGFNYSLLITDFIKDLKKGNAESLEFHHERFRKYGDKHFKSAQNKREKIFTKLLMLLCNDAMNPKASIAKGKKLVEKLAETPPPGDAFAEVEIVPYEQLWDICIGILQHNLAQQKWRTKS